VETSESCSQAVGHDLLLVSRVSCVYNLIPSCYNGFLLEFSASSAPNAPRLAAAGSGSDVGADAVCRRPAIGRVITSHTTLSRLLPNLVTVLFTSVRIEADCMGLR
jgi:hypothetical protein